MDAYPRLRKYPLDVTGMSTDNYIHNERHPLKVDGLKNTFTLHAGSFYTESLVLTHEGIELTKPTDYSVYQLDVEAVKLTGKDVAMVIVINNEALTGFVDVSYQCVGGQFQETSDAMVSLIDSHLNDHRVIHYDRVKNKPDSFHPHRHLHHVDDIYGLAPIANPLLELIELTSKRLPKEDKALWLKYHKLNDRFNELSGIDPARIAEIGNDIGRLKQQFDGKVFIEEHIYQDHIDHEFNPFVTRFNTFLTNDYSVYKRNNDEKIKGLDDDYQATKQNYENRIHDLEQASGTRSTRDLIYHGLENPDNANAYLKLTEDGNHGFILEVYSDPRFRLINNQYEELNRNVITHGNDIDALKDFKDSTETFIIENRPIITALINDLNEEKRERIEVANALEDYKNEKQRTDGEITKTVKKLEEDLAKVGGDVTQSIEDAIRPINEKTARLTEKDEEILGLINQKEEEKTREKEVFEERLNQMNQEIEQMKSDHLASGSEFDRYKEQQATDITEALKQQEERLSQSQREAERRVSDNVDNIKDALDAHIETYTTDKQALEGKIKDEKDKIDAHLTAYQGDKQRQTERDTAQDNALVTYKEQQREKDEGQDRRMTDIEDIISRSYRLQFGIDLLTLPTGVTFSKYGLGSTEPTQQYTINLIGDVRFNTSPYIACKVNLADGTIENLPTLDDWKTRVRSESDSYLVYYRSEFGYNHNYTDLGRFIADDRDIQARLQTDVEEFIYNREQDGLTGADPIVLRIFDSIKKEAKVSYYNNNQTNHPITKLFIVQNGLLRSYDLSHNKVGTHFATQVPEQLIVDIQYQQQSGSADKIMEISDNYSEIVHFYQATSNPKEIVKSPNLIPISDFRRTRDRRGIVGYQQINFALTGDTIDNVRNQYPDLSIVDEWKNWIDRGGELTKTGLSLLDYQYQNAPDGFIYVDENLKRYPLLGRFRVRLREYYNQSLVFSYRINKYLSERAIRIYLVRDNENINDGNLRSIIERHHITNTLEQQHHIGRNNRNILDVFSVRRKPPLRQKLTQLLDRFNALPADNWDNTIFHREAVTIPLTDSDRNDGNLEYFVLIVFTEEVPVGTYIGELMLTHDYGADNGYRVNDFMDYRPGIPETNPDLLLPVNQALTDIRDQLKEVKEASGTTGENQENVNRQVQESLDNIPTQIGDAINTEKVNILREVDERINDAKTDVKTEVQNELTIPIATRVEEVNTDLSGYKTEERGRHDQQQEEIDKLKKKNQRLRMVRVETDNSWTKDITIRHRSLMEQDKLPDYPYPSFPGDDVDPSENSILVSPPNNPSNGSPVDCYITGFYGQDTRPLINLEDWETHVKDLTETDQPYWLHLYIPEDYSRPQYIVSEVDPIFTNPKYKEEYIRDFYQAMTRGLLEEHNPQAAFLGDTAKRIAEIIFHDNYYKYNEQNKHHYSTDNRYLFLVSHDEIRSFDLKSKLINHNTLESNFIKKQRIDLLVQEVDNHTTILMLEDRTKDPLRVNPREYHLDYTVKTPNLLKNSELVLTEDRKSIQQYMQIDMEESWVNSMDDQDEGVLKEWRDWIKDGTEPTRLKPFSGLREQETDRFKVASPGFIKMDQQLKRYPLLGKFIIQPRYGSHEFFFSFTSSIPLKEDNIRIHLIPTAEGEKRITIDIIRQDDRIFLSRSLFTEREYYSSSFVYGRNSSEERNNKIDEIINDNRNSSVPFRSRNYHRYGIHLVMNNSELSSFRKILEGRYSGYFFIVEFSRDIPDGTEIGEFCLVQCADTYTTEDKFRYVPSTSSSGADANINPAKLTGLVQQAVNQYVAERTNPQSNNTWDLTRFKKQAGAEDWSDVYVDETNTLKATGVILENIGGNIETSVFAPLHRYEITSSQTWRIPRTVQGRKALVTVRASSSNIGNGTVIHSAVRQMYIELPTNESVNIVVGPITSFGNYLTVTNAQEYNDALYPRSLGVDGYQQTGMVTIVV